MQHSQRLDHRLHMLREEVRTMAQERERGERVWRERLQRSQRQLKAKEDELSRQSQYFENFKSQLQHKLSLARDREQSLQSRIYTLEKQLLDMAVSAATGVTTVGAVRITAGTARRREEQERGEGEGEEERKEERRGGGMGRDGDTKQSSSEVRLQAFILGLQEDLKVLLEREESGVTERRRLAEQLQEAQESSHFMSCKVEEVQAELQRLQLSDRTLVEEVEELGEENLRLQQNLRDASSQTPSQAASSPGTCSPCSGKLLWDVVPAMPHQVAAEIAQSDTHRPQPSPRGDTQDLLTHIGALSVASETLDDLRLGTWCSSGGLNLDEAPSEDSDALREAFRSLGLGGDAEALRGQCEQREAELQVAQEQLRAAAQENAELRLQLREGGEKEEGEEESAGGKVYTTKTCDGDEDLVQALNQENRALAARIQELLDHVQLSEGELGWERSHLTERISSLDDDRARLELENQEQGCLITELTRKTEDDLNTIMELQEKLEERQEEHRKAGEDASVGNVLGEEMEQLTRELQNLRAQQQEITSSVVSLREQQREVTLSVQTQTEEKQQLTRSVWSLKEEKDQVSRALEALKLEREHLSRALCGLRDEREQFVRSAKLLKEEKEHLGEAREKLSELQKEKEQLSQTLLALESQRDELTGSVRLLAEQRDRERESDVAREELLCSLSSLRDEEGEIRRQISCLREEETRALLSLETLREEERRAQRNQISAAGKKKTTESCDSRGNSTEEPSELEKEVEALRSELKKVRGELERKHVETKELHSDLCQSELRREEAERTAAQSADRAKRLAEVAGRLEESSLDNERLTAQVEQLQSKADALLNEKSETLTLKAQREEQHRVLTAQLKAKTVALEELNSEYIALKKGKGSGDDLSAALLSLRSRYDDIKAKHDDLLKRQGRTDLDVAPLKAKLSCLALKCQERNSLLAQMMKALHRHGWVDAALTQQVDRLLNDAALLDYTVTFAAGGQRSRGLRLKLQDHSSAAHRTCKQQSGGKQPSAVSTRLAINLSGCGGEAESAAAVTTDAGPAVQSLPENSETCSDSSMQLPVPCRPPDVEATSSPDVEATTSPGPGRSSDAPPPSVGPIRRRSSPEKILNMHEQLQQTLLRSYQAPASRGRAEQPRKSLSFAAQRKQHQQGRTVSGLPAVEPVATPTTLFQAVASRIANISLSPSVRRSPQSKAAALTRSSSSSSQSSCSSGTNTPTSAAPRPAAAAGAGAATDPNVLTSPTASHSTAPSSPTARKHGALNPTPTSGGAAPARGGLELPTSCAQAAQRSPGRVRASAGAPPAAPGRNKPQRPKPDAPADVRSVEVIRTVGQSGLLIGWERPPLDELGCSNGTFVYGYRVFVGDDFHKSVTSSACTKCVLENVDLSVPLHISVQTLGSNGLSSASVHALHRPALRAE